MRVPSLPVASLRGDANRDRRRLAVEWQTLHGVHVTLPQAGEQLRGVLPPTHPARTADRSSSRSPTAAASPAGVLWPTPCWSTQLTGRSAPGSDEVDRRYLVGLGTRCSVLTCAPRGPVDHG